MREFEMEEEGVPCEHESTRIVVDIKDEGDFETEKIRSIFVIGQGEFF